MRTPADFARAMAHLDQAATKELDRAGIDPRLRELIRIRASQLNGCAYCIDMHTKDARAAGETEQRLYALPAWRETPFFTGRERAALALTESVTLWRRRTCRTRTSPRLPRRSSDAELGALISLIVDDQRLERHRRQHPRLAAGLVPAMTAAPTLRPERLRAMHHWPAAARSCRTSGTRQRPRVTPRRASRALATSSAAVAATLGYTDGQTPGGEMLAAVGTDRAQRRACPVTADIENGYGLPPAELVGRLLEAGLAGCNLEDSDPVTRSLTEPARQADFLAAVRAAAGTELVINARVDVFVRPGAEAASRARAG